MIELRHISRQYKTGDFIQKALDDVSLGFRDSEFVAVLGPSGSGKTTLLNIIGGLDKASSGQLIINGVSTKDFKNSNWDTYRNHHVGFVFQSYNLIPHQTILANVELALTLSGISAKERRTRAKRALTEVGLGEHLNKKPNQLSGGQAQRVAIARALVNNPDIILADEPTGALDSETGIQVMDILKKVSENRLVIMVTHNPELARDYASRIVRLGDGRVLEDTNPLSPTEFSATPQAKQKDPKASMSFLTALSLSFNNLMTKKGRTFLTAFAGSIGIMGIAAILALSNGVENFIIKTEQNSMSAMPITITRQAMDFTDLFDTHQQAAEEEFSFHARPEETIDTSSNIPQDETISTMFSKTDPGIKTNDLKEFKAYLDSDESEIKQIASCVVYEYNINPVFMHKDDTGKVFVVGRNISDEDFMPNFSGFGGFGPQGSSTNGFSPMFSNTEVVQSQYDLIDGAWPKNSHEALLVLDGSGKITNYTLYGLGLLDQDKMDTYVKAASSEDTDTKVPEMPSANLTYSQALGLSYTCVPQAYLYEKDNEIYQAKDDEQSLNAAFQKGIDIQVVGVIKQKKEATSASLSPGICYSREIIDEIIDKAKDTDIVKAQLADNKTDVFTNTSFDSLADKSSLSIADIRPSTTETLDPESLMDTMPDITDSLANMSELPSISSLDNLAAIPVPDNLSIEELLDMDMEDLALDPKSIQLSLDDLKEVVSIDDLYSFMKNMPKPDLTELNSLDIPEEALTDIQTEVLKIAESFGPWYIAHEKDFDDTSSTKDIIESFMKDEQTAESLGKIEVLLGTENKLKIESFIKTYIDDQLIVYVKTQTEAIFTKVSSQLSQKIAEAINTQVQTMAPQVMEKLSEGLATYMATYMQTIAEAYMQTMAEAYMQMATSSINVDDIFQDPSVLENLDQMETMYKNILAGTEGTYQGNLHRLGYADKDRPEQILIYPNNFEDKQKIVALISAYNEKMESENRPEQVITYTDFMESIIESISSIINTISMVLIAFVSVSLVVSSIMIGIITYISVLERRKEIGILRAMGASKRNIANVFNAETVIEGFMAGVFAILVVLAISAPINQIVYASKQVPDIMSLPLSSSITLIAISVGLTLLAGFIPARKASRKDPVEALRSE